MQKKLVVVDVDDVLIDLNKSVENKVKSLGYPDFSVDNIVTYDLNKSIDVLDLPKEQQGLIGNGLGCPRDIILDCYSCVDVFSSSAWTENLREGMKLLTSNFDVIINTNCFNSKIASFKLNLFDYCFSDLGLKYSISVGVSKPSFDNAFAVFDDCIDELLKYPIETEKILVDRPQNCEVFNKELLSFLTNAQRVKNFYSGVQFLLERY